MYWSQCNCGSDYCGRTRFEAFEYEYPFLGKQYSPEHYEYEQIFCGIKEDDIEVNTEEDSEDMDDNADKYDVADQYLRML